MKHLRILTCLLAALMCLAFAGCDRGSSDTVADAEYSGSTITITEAEYDDNGNVIGTTEVPVDITITDAEYSAD